MIPRELYDIYYRQVEMRIGGRTRLNRLVTIADLKSCDKSFIYIDRSLLNRVEFERQLDYAINELPKRVQQECGVDGTVELYGSTMWFVNNGERGTPRKIGKQFRYVNWNDVRSGRAALVPLGQDFVIDIDRKDNKWFEGDDGFHVLARLSNYINRSIGLEPSILIGNGAQLRVSVPEIYLSYFKSNPVDWVEVAVNVLPQVIATIVDNIARHFPNHENLNIEVRYDVKIYDPARITRLDYSPHGGVKGYSLVFTPREIESKTWGEVEKLQKSLSYIRMRASQYYPGRWGRVVDEARFRTVLETFLSVWDLDIEFVSIPPAKRPMPRQLMGGWKRVTVPGFGVIEYRTGLNGFGWVEELVRNRIPIRDGRLTMAWFVLPVAIKGPKTRTGRLPPLISLDEALDWLRVCIGRYPSGKPFETYKEKLLDNLGYGDRYNIAKWQNFLMGVDDDGNPLNQWLIALRDSVIEAFAEYGDVRVIERGASDSFNSSNHMP